MLHSTLTEKPWKFRNFYLTIHYSASFEKAGGFPHFKLQGYVTQRRSGRERSRGVTKQKHTYQYMCYHRPVHTLLLFDIYIHIHIYIYIICIISLSCISISVYAICSRNTQRWRACIQKKGVSDEQLWITQETRRRHYDVRIGARANLPKDSGTPGRRKCQVRSSCQSCSVHMGVFENSGTPKSSILIGFSTINHPFWGTTIFGNTHIKLSCFPSIFSIQGRKSWSSKRSCPWTEWQVKIFNPPLKTNISRIPWKLKVVKANFLFKMVPFSKKYRSFSGVIM